MDKRALLRSVFVFGGLDDALLAKIAGQLKEVGFAAGAEIFRQQDPADSFFLVESGEVTITKRLGPGHEKLLAVLGPGSVFGEMAFFSDSPRTANATARSECRLWKIDRGEFMGFVAEEPRAGLRVLSGLLQVAMDRLEQTSRELATVYQTGTIISSGKGLGAIMRGVQEELLLAIPEAENAATFLYNEFNDEYDPVAAPEGAREIAPNHPMLARIREKLGGAVYNDLSGGAFTSEPFMAGARAALVSPILREMKLLGFIVLWNASATNVFRGGHALLVSSVCGQLAAAVENLRYQQEERDRQRLNNARQNW